MIDIAGASHDEITPEEIKAIRGRYGLTQKSFALLLGIGPASMVRYEQGSRPSKANANLIRAARHPAFMAECLERDGALIPKRQCEKALQIIYATVSLDPEEEDVVDVSKTTHHASLKGASGESRNDTRGSLAADRALTMDEMYHFTLQQEVLNEQAANIACDLMQYLMDHGIEAHDKTHPVSILLAQLLGLKKSLVSGDADDEDTLERIRGHLAYMAEFAESLRFDAEVA